MTFKIQSCWWAASLALVLMGLSLPVHGQVQPVYHVVNEDNVAASTSSSAASCDAVAPSCGCKPACDAGCGCGNGCGCAAEAWSLFPNDNCRGIKVGGWVEVGVTTNSYNPANPPNGGGNLPVTFNYRNDEFTLNQAYLYLEREIANDGCGWDIGGRVDLLYGDDYIFTQAVGLETHDDSSPHWNGGTGTGIDGLSRDGFALPQAYLDVAYNNLTARIGHFYTIMGYEVVPATGNFFYSHAYTMQYGEPFTHTGGLLIWNYSDQLTITGGVVNGWDKFDAETDRMSFLGGVTWTSCDERTSLALSVISGQEDGTFDVIDATRTMYSVVLTHNVSDRLQYVLQHDNGYNNSRTAGPDEEWYGVNQYLFYTINDCWKAGGRFEWFRDDDGARSFGNEGNYYEGTVGLNWTPHPNVIVRPEARWDAFDGDGRPFANFTRTNQFTAAVDAIITF